MLCPTALSLSSVSPEETYEPVRGSPHDCIRNNRENSGGQQCSDGPECAPFHELVNDIEHAGEDEDLRDALPTVDEQVAALRWIVEERPGVCAASGARIPGAVPGGEYDRHQRLREKPEMQRTIEPLDEADHICRPGRHP